jgi:hypothetical protein
MSTYTFETINPNKFRTKMCIWIKTKGFCDRSQENCSYAHSEKELQQTKCMHGINCRDKNNSCTFDHTPIDFKSIKIVENYNKQLETNKLIQENKTLIQEYIENENENENENLNIDEIHKVNADCKIINSLERSSYANKVKSSKIKTMIKNISMEDQVVNNNKEIKSNEINKNDIKEINIQDEKNIKEINEEIYNQSELQDLREENFIQEQELIKLRLKIYELENTMLKKDYILNQQICKFIKYK